MKFILCFDFNCAPTEYYLLLHINKVDSTYKTRNARLSLFGFLFMSMDIVHSSIKRDCHCILQCSFSCISAAAMAGSIQLFQSIQKYFQTIGICPSDSSKLDSFNWRIFLALFCYAQQIASASVFFICQAKSVLDYGCSFYTSISMTYCVYYFVILIRQKPQILELIESCEAFIEHRKCPTKNFVWTEIFATSFYFHFFY